MQALTGMIGVVYIVGSIVALCFGATFSTMFLILGLGVVMVGIGQLREEMAEIRKAQKEAKSPRVDA